MFWDSVPFVSTLTETVNSGGGGENSETCVSRGLDGETWNWKIEKRGRELEKRKRELISCGYLIGKNILSEWLSLGKWI